MLPLAPLLLLLLSSSSSARAGVQDNVIDIIHSYDDDTQTNEDGHETPSRRVRPFLTMFPKAGEHPDLSGSDVGCPLMVTPLLETGEADKARDLARVANLSVVESYSAFFTVNKECNSNLFFWFFPAAVSSTF